MRFHSAPVVRLSDAKPVQFGHAARAARRGLAPVRLRRPARPEQPVAVRLGTHRRAELFICAVATAPRASLWAAA